MNEKLIVFDMDDVIWDLNEKASRMAGFGFEKLVTFICYENPLLTKEERENLLKVYQGNELYEDIQFNERLIELINRLYRQYPKYPVHISSNCVSREIKDIKMRQLKSVLDLPEDRIHLNLIDIKESKKKKLPGNIFIFVDDSPHNIKDADAVHKIMPAKPYNKELFIDKYQRPCGDSLIKGGYMEVIKDGHLKGTRVDRPITDKELTDVVMDYVLTDIVQHP